MDLLKPFRRGSQPKEEKKEELDRAKEEASWILAVVESIEPEIIPFYHPKKVVRRDRVAR